jgi:SPP1 gp7 family putative phage head morphogenesis protein
VIDDIERTAQMVAASIRPRIEALIQTNEEMLGQIRRYRVTKALGHSNPHLDRAERYYAGRLLSALRLGLDPLAVANGWASKVTKAALPDYPAQAQAYTSSLAVDTETLGEVLLLLHTNGYLAGTKLSAETLVNLGVTLHPGTAALASSFDWSSWDPGNAAAADLLSGVEGNGLRALLSDAGLTIKSVADTRLEQLGAALARGAASGASADDIAAAITDILDNPDRAEMIATTELNRAVSTASLDSYGANGIERWDWLAEADAEEECADLALGGPYGLGDDTPPAHPHCRCSVSPHIDELAPVTGEE